MASRYDERDDEDLRDIRLSRRWGDECRHCGCRDEPVARSEISQGGWIVFVIMLLFCTPLFWIGLLMTETYHVCADCGRRV